MTSFIYLHILDMTWLVERPFHISRIVALEGFLVIWNKKLTKEQFCTPYRNTTTPSRAGNYPLDPPRRAVSCHQTRCLTCQGMRDAFLLGRHSLKLTKVHPRRIGLNAPKKERSSSSKHQFSGALAVSLTSPFRNSGLRRFRQPQSFILYMTCSMLEPPFFENYQSTFESFPQASK